MSVKLTFDTSAKRDVLSFFNKEINEDGLIVEASNEEPVVGIDGSEVHEKEFAGIKKGSEIFLKTDLISMLKLADKKK